MSESRPKGYNAMPESKECSDCIYSKRAGAGSVSQQDLVCNVLQNPFVTYEYAVCDLFKGFL